MTGIDRERALSASLPEAYGWIGKHQNGTEEQELVSEQPTIIDYAKVLSKALTDANREIRAMDHDLSQEKRKAINQICFDVGVKRHYVLYGEAPRRSSQEELCAQGEALILKMCAIDVRELLR